jgi:polyhydroxybutyrate depolymerase
VKASIALVVSLGFLVTTCLVAMVFALMAPSEPFAVEDAALVERSWTVTGVERTALLHIPESSTEAPLVFVFHGRGGNSAAIAQSMAIHTHWPQSLVVYPQGLPSAIQHEAAGVKPGWQQGIGDNDDRDLAFFDEMLRTLRAEFAIDESRIYATGHSMGGAFTYLLWAARGDVLAAVASSAGTPRNFEDCKPKPAMHIAGERDETILYARQQSTMEAVRELNGCDDAGEPWAMSGALVGTLFPSESGHPFVSLIHPGAHKYPPEASPLIVEFFKEQSGGPDASQDTSTGAERLDLPQPDPSGLPEAPSTALLQQWVEGFCSPPHRRPGTPEYHWAVDYFVDTLKGFGFDEVIKAPIDTEVWEASSWKLTVNQGGHQTMIPSFYEWRSGFTGPEGVTAPMVYVGDELDPGVDVEGKIVVAEGKFSKLVANHAWEPKEHVFSRNKDIFWLAHERGAVGVVFICAKTSFPGYNYREALVPSQDPEIKPAPILYVSRTDGVLLKNLAQREYEATILLQGTLTQGHVFNVHCVLPGQTQDNIIVTSHLDAGFKGAIEDGSGIASVLAQAYIWSQIPVERRPKTLVFVGTATHYLLPLGAQDFVETHRDDLIADNSLIFNVEHVAARDYKEEGDGLAWDGKTIVPLRAFYDCNDAVRERFVDVLEDHPPMQSYFFHDGVKGDLGGYHRAIGDDMVGIGFISSPSYLLT